MPDNPHIRGPRDSGKVAGGEAYEVDYLIKQIHPQVPTKTRAEVKQAIIEATKVKQFHNNRAMITNAALGKLGKVPW